MKIEFTLPRTPASLNVLLRLHFRKRAEHQAIWNTWVWKEWVRYGRKLFTGPVKIKYVLSFPCRRNRDFDNYIGGTKLITDALKGSFIPDDNSSWLKKIEIEFLEGEEFTKVIIEDFKRGDN